MTQEPLREAPMEVLTLRDGKIGNTEAIIKKNMNLNSYNCLSTGS